LLKKSPKGEDRAKKDFETSGGAIEQRFNNETGLKLLWLQAHETPCLRHLTRLVYRRKGLERQVVLTVKTAV
jgi:hypothetical protein